jgi:hypothetical protein
MKYFRLFGVALVALCALGAVMAVSASALPTLLPETITKYTGKSIGETKLSRQGGLAEVTCKSATGEGTVEANRHLGLFKITFEKCKAAGGPCTGLGSAAEDIVSEGSYHVVFDALGATLGAAGVALLFLPAAVHFICTVPIIGEVLDVVNAGGNVLCLVTNPTALTKVFEFQCKGKGGKPEGSTKYYNEGGTLTNIVGLKSSEAEGTATEGAQSGNATTEYSEAALLML